MQVGDFIIQRLAAWGVQRIFGYPGDGINGVMGALDRAKEQVDFIQVPHEEVAAFMACAHAKFTGGPLAPSCRSSDSPMAIACFLDVTFLPLLPLFSVPSFSSCKALWTLSC